MRFFTTAGPVKCDKHYCLPLLTRFDLEELLTLIDIGALASLRETFNKKHEQLTLNE